MLNLRNAPVWLPIFSLLRDFAALLYILSFEPGVTDHAARVGYMWMLPGSLIGREFVAVVGSNLLLALAVGLICRWWSTRKNRKAS